MKKYILSLAVIFSFVGYVLRGQLNKGGANSGQLKNVSDLNSSIPTVQNTNATAAETNVNSDAPTNATNPSLSGLYKDGKYTGTAADAFYGFVQIQATVSGGRLGDVQFFQYPNDRQHSIEINTYALPILRTEAIQAQSSEVDIVSGATDSSIAFKQSLASALNQAKN